MINVLEEHFKSVEEFDIKSKQYLNKEIDPLRFKAFRVAMGIYEQREKETYMVRLRIPGGVINLEQFETVSKLADKYSNGKIHLTSREDIQFQNVELTNVHAIMEKLIKVGIITKGTGGNTVRNVALSPLSGVSSDEVFDVTAYVKEVTDYLIKDPSTMNLPRKYKIAFSNSPEDTANATISDLGFIAKLQDGVKGFEVYGGGGFGGNPRVAIKLSDFIETKEALYYVQAMKELFEKEGDRSNKHKARIRYIVHRLGEEKFLELFNNELNRVKASRNLDLVIEDSAFENTDYDAGYSIEIKDEYKNVIFKQKQDGYYSIYVHPQSGNMNSESINKIINFVKNLGYYADIRLTSTQGLYVRNLKGNDVEKLAQEIEEFSSRFDLDNSVTCAGASTCQLGLCLSQGLLKGIKEEFKGASDEIKDALPRLFISGCPNSCGQHQKGAIGFSGRAIRSEDGLVPSYSISFGGFVGAGGAKMGEVFGDIPAKKIPKYLLDLAGLKVSSEIKDFEKFLKEKREDIKKLVEDYSSVDSAKENPELYYDFGASKKFSIEGRGAGECSTGVFDVIKLDLANADSSLQKFSVSKSSADLYSGAVSAARALLILKGVDTDKDRQIFKEFSKHFIEEGYVKESIKDLFDELIDYKLGDVSDITSKEDDIKYLATKVKDMYASLNGQLEITLAKETEIEAEKVEDSKPSVQVVDFRGVQCPINFVKVKVELSKIKSGDQRGFYLDDGAPINNVPKSVEKEGHKIVSIDTNYDGYNLLVIEKK